MPSEARLEIFLKKYKKKGPKIHCLALKLYTGPPNCITGASKSGGRGGAREPGPPPGSASVDTLQMSIVYFLLNAVYFTF